MLIYIDIQFYHLELQNKPGSESGVEEFNALFFHNVMWLNMCLGDIVAKYTNCPSPQGHSCSNYSPLLKCEITPLLSLKTCQLT